MIDSALKGMSDEQKHLSKMQYETKTASKKSREEYQKLESENQKILKKLSDQSRLFEKISETSFKYHKDKTAVRHRELEYLAKRDFYKFVHKLRDSMEMVFQCLKDGFKRDVAIANNLFESHFHPSGKGLTVSTQCHHDLKIYKFDVLKKGFKKPWLPINEDDNMTTFRGSEGSPDVGVELTDIKVKKTKSVKPKRVRSKSEKDITQKASNLQPKQQKSQTIVGSFDLQEKKSVPKIKK